MLLPSCEYDVGSTGCHVLACTLSAERIPCPTAMNVFRRPQQGGGVPALLGPRARLRDGKRPDELTIYPFPLLLHTTCTNIYVESWLAATTSKAVAETKQSESRKRHKYVDMERRYRFQLLAFETIDACGMSTKAFIRTGCSDRSSARRAKGHRAAAQATLTRCYGKQRPVDPTQLHMT